MTAPPRPRHYMSPTSGTKGWICRQKTARLFANTACGSRQLSEGTDPGFAFDQEEKGKSVQVGGEPVVSCNRWHLDLARYLLSAF